TEQRNLHGLEELGVNVVVVHGEYAAICGDGRHGGFVTERRNGSKRYGFNPGNVAQAALECLQIGLRTGRRVAVGAERGVYRDNLLVSKTRVGEDGAVQGAHQKSR